MNWWVDPEDLTKVKEGQDNPWHLLSTQHLKCECGVAVTYGKDAPLSYHADYCPIGKELAKQLINDKQVNSILKGIP